MEVHGGEEAGLARMRVHPSEGEEVGGRAELEQRHLPLVRHHAHIPLPHLRREQHVCNRENILVLRG